MNTKRRTNRPAWPARSASHAKPSPTRKPRRSDRDIERLVSIKQFITTLRRIADALEKERAAIITVRGERVRIPQDAQAGIEHEREGAQEEIELQLRWKR